MIIDLYICFATQTSQVACHAVLKKFLETVKGKARLGIQAYADGLMVIPKTLATNAGYDSQEVMVKLLEEARDGASVGMDCDTGEACIPKDKGIYDNYRWVVLHLALVDVPQCFFAG